MAQESPAVTHALSLKDEVLRVSSVRRATANGRIMIPQGQVKVQVEGVAGHVTHVGILKDCRAV